jgi:FkbM family methyltransferase
MKTRIKWFLQNILGFDQYLFVFSLFKIFTLQYDRHEGHFLRFLTLIPDRGVVLDIGANIGIMTALLARGKPERIVYAFEPMPRNFRALSRVVRLFRLRNVQLWPYALGDENREIEMVMPVADGVRLQGISHVILAETDSEPGERVRAVCKRLDDLDELPTNEPLVGVKIDVENYESFVFQGGCERLRRWQPVIYAELGPGHNRETSLALLSGLGYQAQVLEGQRLVVFDPVRHHDYGNLFLIPAGHSAYQ